MSNTGKARAHPVADGGFLCSVAASVIERPICGVADWQGGYWHTTTEPAV
jgi:hypothetical protein